MQLFVVCTKYPCIRDGIQPFIRPRLISATCVRLSNFLKVNIYCVFTWLKTYSFKICKAKHALILLWLFCCVWPEEAAPPPTNQRMPMFCNETSGKSVGKTHNTTNIAQSNQVLHINFKLNLNIYLQICRWCFFPVRPTRYSSRCETQ